MSLNYLGSLHLFFLTLLLLIKCNSFEGTRKQNEVSNLVDYSIKPVKGKIDIKMLIPKIPKYIQVYIAVAFSERDFPSYSKIFNKTLSSIPNSFLILDSLNRHYNVSVSPLFFVLPNSGRFSSSIYEVLCNSFDKKRVVAILVIGESPAAFTVSLAAITSNIPVLWARGGNPTPPGSLQQHNLLEIRLEPNEYQILEAVRGVFLATHWHSFTVVAAPSLATRCASILNLPPLNPKVVPITQNPQNIFRKLADVSRSTRGVVLLICDFSEASLVMNVAKKLSMIDGHFVWIWIDTTTKPASFLSLPSTPISKVTKKITRDLEKPLKNPRIIKKSFFLKQDEVDVNSNSSAKSTDTDNGIKNRNVEVNEINKVERNFKFNNKSIYATTPNKTLILESESFELLENTNRSSKNEKIKKRNVLKKAYETTETKNLLVREGNQNSSDKKIKNADVVKLPIQNSIKEKLKKNEKKWIDLANVDYLNDFAVQLDYSDDKRDIEEIHLPTSKAWGKITEHFPIKSFGKENYDDEVIKNSNLPVGLLSVKPEPLKLDRHLVKGSVRLLVSTLHSVLKKSADWLSILDSDSSCWTKPSLLNKNFSEVYAKEIRQAVKDSLSGQPHFQEGDRADRSLLANFQILNLVPEKLHINFNNDENVIEDAVLYWRQVGKVLGKSAHLNTIVWPGGDLVASALSARTRSVFRIVTALAPPFVMEGALDEDGQCLRGVICHRVLNSDKDNLTLVFNEMDTQERMEDEVEELGRDERTEKPFRFFDNSYFEYQTTKYKYKSSCCYGLAMDLLENVAQELEFEFHLYIIPDGAYGAKNHVWEQGAPRSKWNGIVGDLVSGAAHMSFAALSVSKQRSQVIDFSTPYFFSGVSFLAAPTQKSEVPLLAFLLPFSTELWIAIFTSLNITAMAVACYEWLSPFGLNPWGRQRSRNFSIASALWVMWGLLCGHLVAFKAPKSWPNKFLINVWGGFSVIFVASYTANIAALIAGLFFHNSVSDYHDRSLLSQRVGAPKSSSADYYIHRANQHLWEHMQKYSFKDVETGISLLRNGSLDILIADTPILDYYRATDHGCKLQKIVEAINEDTYAIGMNKGFPLKESISAVISKYSNNGYMDILTEKWYGGLPCFKMTPSVELTDVGQPRPLGVAAVAGVFLLLGLGMVIGILILILEHLFYRYTLPLLRNQPKGTIWRSRNVMFFSQKLYRFINCVELVSPHHAARELVHTLRQGHITSLFQKSVKRKEHEQRRRRKSKAQFFEMIQEIRRVQQEGKEERKYFRKDVEGTELSPKTQIRGFLTSPRSLKHFCSSKSSVSPQVPVDRANSLNPSVLLEQRKSLKSPSRLDIRRFSKELFSLPWSPKSVKTKSSVSLETRRLSSDLDYNKTKNELKVSQMPDVRMSAKDIRIQASKTIGRRLSKDASSWLTNSPPDLNSRRKSYMDIMHPKSLSVSENILDGTFKSKISLNDVNSNTTEQLKDSRCGEDLFCKSATLTPTISKAATIRLASSGNTNASKSVKIRPRLPSPPKSPVMEFRNTQAPKISVSDADNLYETIKSKNEITSKKLPKSFHSRSKSLDNKNINFETMLVDIITDSKNNFEKNAQTVKYATLEHKENNTDDISNERLTASSEKFILKNTHKDGQSGTQDRGKENRSFAGKKVVSCSAGTETSKAKDFATSKNTEPRVTSAVAKDFGSIYAEPQKLKKKQIEKSSTVNLEESLANNKPKVPPKSTAVKLKQARACSAPESDRDLLAPSVFYASEERTKKNSPEYNYYSEKKRTHNSNLHLEQNRETRGRIDCFDTFPATKGRLSCSSQRRLWRETDQRSRSVPEQYCLQKCNENDKLGSRGQLDTSTFVLQQFSKSLDVPYKNRENLKMKKKSRSRDDDDFSGVVLSLKGTKKRNDVHKKEFFSTKKPPEGHSEPP